MTHSNLQIPKPIPPQKQFLSPLSEQYPEVIQEKKKKKKKHWINKVIIFLSIVKVRAAEYITFCKIFFLYFSSWYLDSIWSFKKYEKTINLLQT